jgi:uncharacterized membrane protein YdcZ (DUF606 family)
LNLRKKNLFKIILPGLGSAFTQKKISITDWAFIIWWIFYKVYNGPELEVSKALIIIVASQIISSLFIDIFIASSL